MAFRLKPLVLILFYIFCILLVVKIALNSDAQWDFRVYYTSTVTLNSGLDPYNVADLSKINGRVESIGYVYPPSTFLFFQPFLILKLEIAQQVFITLKCIALIVLIKLWEKAFLSQKPEGLFYLFCLIAFNNPIYTDFVAGNISVFEQLLIWAGLYFFLKQRYSLFSSLILLAALFKVTPLLFLSLLWSTANKRKHLYVFGPLLVFVIVQLLTCLWNVNFMIDFLKGTIGLEEHGIINPSTFLFIKEFSTVLAALGLSLPIFVQLALYLAIVTAIIAVSLKANRKLRYLDVENEALIRVLLFCVVLALILPRFKEYSYILLLVPAYFILKRTNFKNKQVLLFAFMVLLPNVVVNVPQSTIPFVNVVYTFAYDYYPLLLAYSVWGLYLLYIFKPQAGEIAELTVQFMDEAQTLQR